MKKVFVLVSFIVIALVTTVSCDKSDNVNQLNNHYEQYSLANFKVTIDKESGLMMVDLENSNEFSGVYISNNINIVDGKLSCSKDLSFYFIPFDNNTVAQRMMEPVYNCDCPDSPSPYNNCEDYLDDKKRLRCRGYADCCEGYITDDDVQNKGEGIKYPNGIIVACNSLILQGKKY